MKIGHHEISLDELESLIKNNPLASNLVKKALATSYEDFVELLYDDLDIVINELEANPQHYFDDEEDKITHVIVSMLRMRNHKASQGTTSGGNVDITVDGPQQGWNWIGEAKIYKSLTDLNEGFLQLTTRYRNASPNHSMRGIVAYTKRPKAAELLADWHAELVEKKLDGFASSACVRRGALAFHTTHKDHSTGLPVAIRHIAVCLHHLPKDKSGRSAAKYKGRDDD